MRKQCTEYIPPLDVYLDLDPDKDPDPLTCSATSLSTSSAKRSALSLLANCLVCTRKSLRWCLKGVNSRSSNMPETHATT